MDPFQILIVVGFILFSLLQLLAERRGGAKPPTLPPPHDYGEEGQAPLGTSAPPRAEAPEPPAYEEWIAEAEALEQPAGEEAADEELLRAPYSPRAEETIPEAVRVSAPVVSLEPLVVDRVAEHQRFHRRTAPPLPRVATRSAAPTLSDGLRGPAALRRAVLLNEVLGPPKALRED